jgi:hypothetical protein
MQDTYADLSFRQVMGVLNERTVPTMTPGEYVSTLIRARLDDDTRTLETLARAVQNESIADTLGIVPTLILGDLIKFVDATRYVVTSMRPMPMPAGGKQFNRPRMTTRTLAGQQVNEFDQLQSRAMVIDPDPVTKHTHGTVLNVSEQDIDWTDPALMQIAIEDMAESYAISTEAEAGAAVEAAIVHGTNDGTLDPAATAPVFHQALANGAASCYSTAKMLPDTLYASVDRWAYMVGLVDADGRPMYPTLGPVNAPGQLNATSWDGAPMGLKFVVSPAFRPGFVALGASRYIEKYEQVKGLLQIPDPSTLSVVVAYRGYFTENVQTKALFALSELNTGGTAWGNTAP